MMAPAVRSALQSIKVPVLIMAASSELEAMTGVPASADSGNGRLPEMPDAPADFKGRQPMRRPVPDASARLNRAQSEMRHFHFMSGSRIVLTFVETRFKT